MKITIRTVTIWSLKVTLIMSYEVTLQILKRDQLLFERYKLNPPEFQ
jgi:hypothetical protein